MNAITLEDALSHRTGMPRHELSYGREGVDTSRKIVRNLRNLPLHTPLRTHFEYCNIMYVAASHALEVATKKPNFQTFRERLWIPLDMRDTYSGFHEAMDAIAADKTSGAVLTNGYTWSKLPDDIDEANGVLMGEAYLDADSISGAGSVISTADDYVKWMRCLLSGSAPLSPEIIEEIWTPRAIVPPEEREEGPFDGVVCYCLGWFKATYRGREIVWHPGGLPGSGSLILLLPAQKWGVSFFANGMGVSGTLKSLAFWLIDEILDTPEGERTCERVDKE
jgi:CubicO group peptidase (beta-lactamase class C family)